MRIRGKAQVLGAFLAAFLGVTPLVAQETGSIVGLIQSQAGEPIPGAQVSVVGTTLGTITQDNGRFLIRRVPAGAQELQVQLIGYGTEARDVTVPAGGTATVNLTLTSEAIALEEIIVTGVSGATVKAKVPFEVTQVDAADLPVPALTAGSAIQGKVAGVQVVQGSGRPGSAPSILLRGATSINASGRSQDPLYIVDGVILGSGLADLNSMDIESIEVVKGAAAASLYGSRAANGVVQITTRRGRSVGADEIRYTARTEFGVSELGSTPSILVGQSHPYETVEQDGTVFFVEQDSGELCRYLECSEPAVEGTSQWDTYYDNPWPTTYDQVDRFFENGSFARQYLSAEGRSGATNFHVSYAHDNDEGVLPGLQGYDRHNFRVNVDQSVIETIQVSASAFYSTSTNDLFPENSGNPMFTLTRTRAGTNIFACEPSQFENPDDAPAECLDQPENLILQTDPANSEADNPVYALMNRRYSDNRNRFLGSASLRWNPLTWFDVQGNVSYDRLGQEQTDYFPKGYRTITASPTFNEGFLDRYIEEDESLNASVTGTFRFNLNPDISNRTQLRYLYEQNEQLWTYTSGYEFAVADIPQFGNVNQTNLGASSSFQPVRADGYFALTNFDLYDKYIIDALIRNDGSSLFGEDQRRQWYYRLAGAWRLGQESWFTVPGVNDIKLRYSYGTAGGRPNFNAQYETYSVAGGGVVPLTLGNNNLKPEFSKEHEMGMDVSLLDNRMAFTLTYANTETEDQILPVPLPRYTGYTTQWQNAGTLHSKTWEMSLDARLIDAGDFQWNARVLWDRTRSTITELSVPQFRYGVPGQNLGNVFYAREGEELGTFYGVQFAQECSDLPSSVQAMCDSEFAVNEDGFLVWVGDHGLGNQEAWGEVAPAAIQSADGAGHLFALNYGVPFSAVCEDRVSGEERLFCEVGNSVPDWSGALSSTVSWGGLSLYGLVETVRGIDVYNQPLQWATYAQTNALFDQSDIPEGERRPQGYFDAFYHNVGGLQPSSYFVEDGSFTKLRELSLRYTFGGGKLADLFPVFDQLRGVSIFGVGRNLLTWTDYRGFDPEVGKSGGATGSSALARVEGYQYPNFRTWTFGAELSF